jgi:hypothetical protein
MIELGAVDRLMQLHLFSRPCGANPLLSSTVKNQPTGPSKWRLGLACDSGILCRNLWTASRRCALHRRTKLPKRLLTHVGAFNIRLVLQEMLGAGKPRELKNRMAELISGAHECLDSLYSSQAATNSKHCIISTFLDPNQFIIIFGKTGGEMDNSTSGSWGLTQNAENAAMAHEAESIPHDSNPTALHA